MSQLPQCLNCHGGDYKTGAATRSWSRGGMAGLFMQDKLPNESKLHLYPKPGAGFLGW